MQLTSTDYTTYTGKHQLIHNYRLYEAPKSGEGKRAERGYPILSAKSSTHSYLSEAALLLFRNGKRVVFT